MIFFRFLHRTRVKSTAADTGCNCANFSLEGVGGSVNVYIATRLQPTAIICEC